MHISDSQILVNEYFMKQDITNQSPYITLYSIWLSSLPSSEVTQVKFYHFSSYSYTMQFSLIPFKCHINLESLFL